MESASYFGTETSVPCKLVGTTRADFFCSPESFSKEIGLRQIRAPSDLEGCAEVSCRLFPISAAGAQGEEPLVDVGKGSRQIESLTLG
jgi:hypothetical protein